MNHEEQMAFMYHIFSAQLPRLGPGDDPSTLRAVTTLLKYNKPLKERAATGNLKVLDVGCGNGTQTLQLARQLGGTILALDNHQPFLDELKRRAAKASLSSNIEVMRQDMGAMNFEKHSFDLIWSEGALYNMGFQNGLTTCSPLLVPGGLMAVTELCWFKPDPPPECCTFFAKEYPAMADISTNIEMIQASGLRLRNHFTLPDSAWWNNYYTPLERRLQSLQKTFADDPERRAMIENVFLEIEQFRQHSAYYGYIFYLMQTNNH